MQVTVVGGASKREYVISVNREDLPRNLMFFLREKGITIASSCDGDGVCQKCVIQNDWLSCQLTLEEFFERRPDGKVFVSYL